MEQRRFALALALTSSVILLIVAFALYWAPTVPYMGEDACITSPPPPGKKRATASEGWSWLPPGAECRGPDTPGDRQQRRYILGPSPAFAWVSLGSTAAALLVAATGIFVNISDIRRRPHRA